MATKPIKFLELHYTMTQFLITLDIALVACIFVVCALTIDSCFLGKFVVYHSAKAMHNQYIYLVNFVTDICVRPTVFIR